MIRVTKFDGKSMMLNAEWIQSVESTPDTVITLTNGLKILVRESLTDVVAAFKEYKRDNQVPINSILRKVS